MEELLLLKDLWLSAAESTHQHWQAFRHLHLGISARSPIPSLWPLAFAIDAWLAFDLGSPPAFSPASSICIHPKIGISDERVPPKRAKDRSIDRCRMDRWPDRFKVSPTWYGECATSWQSVSNAYSISACSGGVPNGSWLLEGVSIFMRWSLTFLSISRLKYQLKISLFLVSFY